MRSRDKVVVLDLDILFLRSKTGFCILIINYNTKENNLVSAHKVKRIYLVFSGMPKTKTKKNASKFLVNATSCHFVFQGELVYFSLFHNMTFQASSDRENQKIF